MTDEEREHAGMIPCYDENMNITRWITKEQSELEDANFDPEYMCPKPMASYLRQYRELQQKKSAAQHKSRQPNSMPSLSA